MQQFLQHFFFFFTIIELITNFYLHPPLSHFNSSTKDNLRHLNFNIFSKIFCEGAPFYQGELEEVEASLA